MSWDPTKAKELLDLELIPTEGEEGKTPEQVATEKLKQAVPISVAALAYLAENSDSESVRLRACEIIINKVLGKPTDEPLTPSRTEDKLVELLTGTVSVEYRDN